LYLKLFEIFEFIYTAGWYCPGAHMLEALVSPVGAAACAAPEHHNRVTAGYHHLPVGAGYHPPPTTWRRAAPGPPPLPSYVHRARPPLPLLSLPCIGIEAAKSSTTALLPYKQAWPKSLLPPSLTLHRAGYPLISTGDVPSSLVFKPPTPILW
jgi:hypothetical protein